MRISYDLLLLIGSVLMGLAAVFWGALENILLQPHRFLGSTCPLGYTSQNGEKTIGIFESAHGHNHAQFHMQNGPDEMASDVIYRYFNGVIITSNDDMPYVSWLTVRNGHFVEMGNDSDLPTVDGKYESVNLHKHLVTAGLGDVHVHFLSGGMSLKAMSLKRKSMQTVVHELESIVKDRRGNKRGNRTISEWIIGYNFEGEFDEQDCNAISQVSPRHPVVLYRFDAHQVLVNRLVLQIAGIDEASSDPEGGKIGRQAGSRVPNGILYDASIQMATRHMPEASEDDLKEALIQAQNYAFQRGVTFVHDMGRVAFEVGHEAALDDLQNIYMPAARSGDLKIRLRSFVSLHVWEPLVEMIRVFGTREDRLSFGSVKEFFDGSLSSRTAYMHKDYIDDNGNRGIRTVNLSQFESQLFDAHRAGLQIGVHAIGSQAVDEVVSFFQKVQDAEFHISDASQDTPFRHRIEHAQHLSSWDVLDKMKKIGIQITPNPLHMKSDMEIVHQRLGSEGEKFAYAFGKFVSHHINMGLASDWPVADMDPWATLLASMDPSNEHSLSFTQALHYVTRGAAKLGDIDEDIGMIAQGMQADFVIHSCDSSNKQTDGRIPQISQDDSIPAYVKYLIECRSGVKETYVQGECVFGCNSEFEE
eukprot:jgi/Picsp_1/2624/NSC_00854-R1_amidohydrolase family protein